jgi:hypothetical protein
MTHFLSHHCWCVFIRDVGLASLCLATAQGWANESQHIYRCGNAYTNQPAPTQNCKLVSNTASRVIVIEGTRAQTPRVQAAQATSSDVKVDSADQRQRDTQAQAVLQAELQKAQKQHAELLREWNNGEPERRADEFRQPQKYQDRVAQLRGAMQRVEADVAGLQRELSRLSVATQTGVKP